MIDVLLLRFDAPLMSFGGVRVDNINRTERFPGLSMVAGLFANALGWDHRDADRTGGLQSRLRIAARCDRHGEPCLDFQTVDLGQDFLEREWTTRGVTEAREGGDARKGTHIRHRHFLANAVYTVAVALAQADTPPTLDELGAALENPARPLFLGRKCALPAAPLFLAQTRAASLHAALAAHPRLARDGDPGPLSIQWPELEGEPRGATSDTRRVAITDERDWVNQIHVGRRFAFEGKVNPPAAPRGAS